MHRGAGAGAGCDAHATCRRGPRPLRQLGDMHAPALPEREALGQMVNEFAAAITEGRPARTDGNAGIRVLRVLEASTASLASGGALVPLTATGTATRTATRTATGASA